MPTPYEAPVLKRLKTTIDTRWPERDHSSDGWIGNEAHQARTSDHNPDPKSGVVRARDTDADGVNPRLIIASAMVHPATKYVIFNRKIYRYADQFYPRSYDGSNPHTGHIHVSIKTGKLFEESKAPWVLIRGFAWKELRQGMVSNEARQLQALLNAHGGTVRADGRFGEKTLVAVRAFQKRKRLKVDGLVGPKTQAALAR